MSSIPKPITHYYRDNEELSFEMWMNLFKKDLIEEEKDCEWNIRSAVYTDYANGRDCDLNGHEYKQRTDLIYSTAKELLDDMLSDGRYDEIFTAIESLSEEEAEIFIKYINRVKRNNQQFILEDERE